MRTKGLHAELSARSQGGDTGSNPVGGATRRSGDLHGVLQAAGDRLREGHDEVAAERGGDAGEGVEPVAGAAAFLEAGDDGLGGAHPLGQGALAESCLGAQFVDQLAEREVLFDRRGAAGAGSPRCFLRSSQRE